MSGDFSLLRVAVIGLGPMGQNHARAVTDTAGARLAGVVDIDPRLVAKAAATYSSPVFADVHGLIGHIDAAVIAVPPEHHAAVAVPLLKAGIACLIEKPLTATPAQADELAAAAGSACIAVGHIERFNPAIAPVLALGLEPSGISHVTAVRLAPVGGRAVATDVVADMMVHDIDITVKLKGADVVAVQAEGDLPTRVSAVLRYADGTEAQLVADRAAAHRERSFKFRADGDAIEVDFLGRRASRNGHEFPITPQDALRTQLEDFLDAIQARREPRVSLADGRACMDLVWRVQAAVLERAP
ncbi:MAG: Gfo/Idh/MocA family oxidoreductase [Rhodospirillaceae bacterium]|nr:Gfo/Idh/MocA family oxidoreductase [Rhodospirillaceae bacterium]